MMVKPMEMLTEMLTQDNKMVMETETPTLDMPTVILAETETPETLMET